MLRVEVGPGVCVQSVSVDVVAPHGVHLKLLLPAHAYDPPDHYTAIERRLYATDLHTGHPVKVLVTAVAYEVTNQRTYVDLIVRSTQFALRWLEPAPADDLA